MKDNSYYQSIYQQFLSNNCTKEELEELLSYLEHKDGELVLCIEIDKVLQNFSTYTIQESEQADRLVQRLDPIIQEYIVIPNTKVSKAKTKNWIVAAAIVSLLLGIWSFQFLFTPNIKDQKDKLIVDQGEKLEPGTNRATVILNDGSTYVLSENQEGIQMNEDGIQYTNGEVLIDNLPLMQLVVQTPRAGQYSLTLPDGSKVWMNAASTIRYPSRFEDAERTVEIDGEAYFEVSKDKNRPFVVKTKKETIRVLGTNFNVNAYDEDSKSTIALLEGSVRVDAKLGQSKILKPNQQVINTGELRVQRIDPTEALAWRNGEFMFNDVALAEVMKQIERWYDIEVLIDDSLKSMLIWGTISKYENLDKVLNIIKLTDERIKVKVKGRRVELMR